MSAVGNLALVGPPGVGKSSLATALGGILSLPVRDLDAEIESATGESVSALFDRFGEAHFRAQEHAVLHSLLAADGQVIACGAGVVLATRNREMLAERAWVVWLHTSIDVLEARLRGDDSRPLLRTHDLEARLAELANQRDPLYEEVANLKFAVGSASVADSAAELSRLLPASWLLERHGD